MTTPNDTPPNDGRLDPADGPSAPPATATPAADAAGADTAHEPEVGNRWSTPTPERRAALDARLAEWAVMPDHGDLLGPFDRDGWYAKLTGADLYYLTARSLVGPKGNILEGLALFRNDPLVFLPDLHLEHADLVAAQLGYWSLSGAHLESAYLDAAHLEHASLVGAYLAHASLSAAHLDHTKLGGAHLDYAVFYKAHLEQAGLGGAHLEHAHLVDAHLEDAFLDGAHLERANLLGAQLAGADLRRAFLDVGTDLSHAIVTDAEHGSVRVADVRWQGVNLAVVKEWPADMVLGDEQEAWRLTREPLPQTKTRKERREAVNKQQVEVREAFREAARANRQLAAAMRDQGMNDEADHFAYRAQLMQRELYRRQGRRFRAGFSRFLDVIAGYGYKPERSVAAYVLVILTFALAYFALSHLVVGPPLSAYGAAVFSMTSFHGRGFFPGGISIEDPITGLAALEALCGLIIEVSLIATFTQRFFGK